MMQEDLFYFGEVGTRPAQKRAATDRQARQEARENREARARAAIEANTPISAALDSIPYVGRTKFVKSMIILLRGGKPAHELTTFQREALAKVWISAQVRKPFHAIPEAALAELYPQFDAVIEGIKKAMESVPGE